MAKKKDDLHASHSALVRRSVSRTLRSTALLMLVAGLVIYLVMWWSALRMHLVPSSWGNHGGGHHGPWRPTGFLSGLQNLRQLWYNVFWAFCCATLAAVLALATAPSRKRVYLLVFCLVLTGIYFYTHSWLVD
jgi:hypothetical protein